MERYETYADVIITSQKKRRYSTMYYPTPEIKSSDHYIITKRSDRLDLLANRYYNDPRKWIVIAKANKLHAGTLRVPIGVRLRIPFPYNDENIHREFINKQF